MWIMKNFVPSPISLYIASSASDPAYRCLLSSEALLSLDILWLSRQSVCARHFQPNSELSMPRDFTFTGASVPQKEVECSGEAARDMANDKATVFENGSSVSVFFISLLHFCSQNFSQKWGQIDLWMWWPWTTLSTAKSSQSSMSLTHNMVHAARYKCS